MDFLSIRIIPFFHEIRYSFSINSSYFDEIGNTNIKQAGYTIYFRIFHFKLKLSQNCDSTYFKPYSRYPDIKCYDQTRVKLSEIEDVDGSDYINANFVNGYKDRKRWICAQGPLDHTVADFWRMVYEQGGGEGRELLKLEYAKL